MTMSETPRMRFTPDEHHPTKSFIDSLWFKFVVIIVAVVMVPLPMVLTAEFIHLGNKVNRNAQTSYVNTCRALNRALAAVNGVGHENSDFVDKILVNTVARSTASTKATLASPSSTPEQKLTAERNLIGAELLLDAARVQIKANNTKVDKKTHPLDCSYPPTGRI